MRSSPYRTIAERENSTGAYSDRRCDDDFDLLPVFALLWIACVARIASAFVDHRPLDAMMTLTALAAVMLPILVWRSLLALVHAAWRAIKKR